MTLLRVPLLTATLTGSLKLAAAAPSAGVTVMTAAEVLGALLPPEPGAPLALPPDPPPFPLPLSLLSLQAASSRTGAPISPARTPRRLQLPRAARP